MVPVIVNIHGGGLIMGNAGSFPAKKRAIYIDMENQSGHQIPSLQILEYILYFIISDIKKPVIIKNRAMGHLKNVPSLILCSHIAKPLDLAVRLNVTHIVLHRQDLVHVLHLYQRYDFLHDVIGSPVAAV